MWPEVGRRQPSATRIAQCDGDSCEWCAAGIGRYKGQWVDEPPSEQYPHWTPFLVGHWVEEGSVEAKADFHHNTHQMAAEELRQIQRWHGDLHREGFPGIRPGAPSREGAR